ncbi:MAG: putative bifunctional diguanylate cyclase/phosphodiesterase [Lachnospiraceae bacterium]
MSECEISLGLLTEIINESLNPMACVKVVDYEDGKAIRFVLYNHAFQKLFGGEGAALEENVLMLSDIAEMNQNDAMFAAVLDVYETEKDVYRLIELPYLGKIFNLKAFAPEPGYIAVVLADVTEFEKAKKEAEEACNLAASTSEQLKYQVDLLTATQKQMENTTRIHQIVAQSSSDGFFYKNYLNGTFFATDSWYELFTYDGIRPMDNTMIGNAISDLDVFEFSRWREKAVMEKKEAMNCEFRLGNHNTWIEASYRFIYDENQKLVEEIAYFKDITTVKNQKEELAYKAYYDTSTGLMNRGYLTKLLDEDILRAREEDVPISILYIDIDDFKNINDTIGYKMADDFILKFAMMLKDYENGSTRIARFDSDEFVISIYDGTRHAAQSIAVDIRKRLAEPVTLANGLTQRMTVSIGINQYPEGGKKAVDLISNADIALHRVKESGKNSVLFFDEGMLEQFLVKIEMENTIKRALENDRFVLYYQPQYDVITKKIRGVEALIRMKDEVLGFVSPLDFIPLAERNGMIVEIGEWVLRKAFEDYLAWKEAYDFDGIISVNISTVQFKQITFESTLYALIREYMIPPECVELEITESVFVENSFQLVEMIKRIRNNGIRVSLDDFGTGYSSLSYLKNIPIDTLKIDKSFIDQLGEQKASDIITGSLIEMMHKLGLEVVAEGVETQEQLEILKKMSCDSIQGFYLGKPMNADGMRATIREEKC